MPTPTKKRATPRVSLQLNTDGGANQADGQNTEINGIMAQYKKNGTLPNVAQRNPLYGDFTFGNDLQDITNAIYEAEDRFNDLPATVRAAAQNNMVQFVQMYADETQRERLVDAGLIIEIPLDPQGQPTPFPQTPDQSSSVTPPSTTPPIETTTNNPTPTDDA